MGHAIPIALTKDRIAEAMNIRNMKAVELSEKSGIPKASISHYLSGRVVPKQDRIYLLADALNVDTTWLIGYDVPMERQTVSAIMKNDDGETQLIELYRQLSEEKKKMVLDMIKIAIK